MRYAIFVEPEGGDPRGRWKIEVRRVSHLETIVATFPADGGRVPKPGVGPDRHVPKQLRRALYWAAQCMVHDSEWNKP